jgi:tRNA A37 N6-isopentenylltransferase MiaA
MANKRKKQMAIKIPRDTLRVKSEYEIVREYLQKNKDYAYTVQGLMKEAFEVPEEEMTGSFTIWAKGRPALYSRINKSLNKLVDESLVECFKQGKAYYYIWNIAQVKSDHFLKGPGT